MHDWSIVMIKISTEASRARDTYSMNTTMQTGLLSFMILKMQVDLYWLESTRVIHRAYALSERERRDLSDFQQKYVPPLCTYNITLSGRYICQVPRTQRTDESLSCRPLTFASTHTFDTLLRHQVVILNIHTSMPSSSRSTLLYATLKISYGF